jgi:hypothetical protein
VGDLVRLSLILSVLGGESCLAVEHSMQAVVHLFALSPSFVASVPQVLQWLDQQ